MEGSDLELDYTEVEQKDGSYLKFKNADAPRWAPSKKYDFSDQAALNPQVKMKAVRFVPCKEGLF